MAAASGKESLHAKPEIGSKAGFADQGFYLYYRAGWWMFQVK